MELKGKNKPEFSEDSTVKVARNRFKNVLKHMVQENFMQDEDDDSENDEREGGQGGYNPNFPTFPSTSTKRRPKNEETPKPQASFVMKLFDRGVDLAQFQEDTPLYPVCRAWIQNKPHTQRSKLDDNDSDKDEDMDYRDDTDEVYRLPAPDPLNIDENNRQITMRVPPPLPREDVEFEINYDDEMAPSPALLFQNHLDRWNTIRQRWRESSAYNETRYHQSFAVLRSIHDRVNMPQTSINNSQ